MRWIAYWMLTGVLALDCFWIANRMAHLISQAETRSTLAQAVTDPATWWPTITLGFGAGVPLACIAFGPYLIERARIFVRQ